MANIYLQVDFATGNIFQWSKDKKEGYDSHTNTKGVESFRKVYKKGLYAKLKGVSIRESNFGKEISLYTEDANGDTVYLNFPLLDAKRNIASYAESLITVLPALVVGETYRFFPYNIKEEGDKYSKIGVSVKLADLTSESLIEGAEAIAKLTYTYTGKDGVEVKGDIPATTWEESFDGVKTKNTKAKDKFLYDTLVKCTTEKPEASETKAPEPKAEAPKKEAPKAKEPEVEHDDLPF